MGEVDHAARYPRHKLEKKEPNGLGGFSTVVSCAEMMMLPEQVGQEETGHLFCLGCGKSYPDTTARIQQAKGAAVAEGWAPSTKGPIVVGALPVEARVGLYWALKRERQDLHPGSETKEAQKSVARAAPTLAALGLFDEHGTLTLSGRELAKQCTDPVGAVLDTLKTDPKLAPKFKRLTPKQRAALATPKCNFHATKPLVMDGDVARCSVNA